MNPFSHPRSETSDLPLSGLKVMDFSRIIAGPMCGQILADLGAEVIKVERPPVGDDAREYVFPPMLDGLSTIFLSFNRGKRSVLLDLREPRQLQALEGWLAQCDVLIENFRPGVMQRLGLDAHSLAVRHPRLIYCSISGFGEVGPLAQAGANDLVAQASTGMMSLNAPGGARPEKVAPAVIDLHTGMHAVVGVMAALLRRARTGRGGHVSTSLFECGTALLSYFATYGLGARAALDLTDPAASVTVPNQAFRAADGWMVVACSNEPMWQRLCQSMGRPELARDDRFATNALRTQHKDALVRELDTLFAAQSRQEWASRLGASSVSCAPVLTLDEVLAHPQGEALGLFHSLQRPGRMPLRVTRLPLRIDGQAFCNPLAPPDLGAHTPADLTGAPTTEA